MMQITAIKRGRTLEISELLEIPDGESVIIEIIDDRLTKSKGNFGDRLEEFRRQHQIAELEIDVDDIFADLRDRQSSDPFSNSQKYPGSTYY